MSNTYEIKFIDTLWRFYENGKPSHTVPPDPDRALVAKDARGYLSDIGNKNMPIYIFDEKGTFDFIDRALDSGE